MYQRWRPGRIWPVPTPPSSGPTHPYEASKLVDDTATPPIPFVGGIIEAPAFQVFATLTAMVLIFVGTLKIVERRDKQPLPVTNQVTVVVRK